MERYIERVGQKEVDNIQHVSGVVVQNENEYCIIWAKSDDPSPYKGYVSHQTLSDFAQEIGVLQNEEQICGGFVVRIFSDQYRISDGSHTFPGFIERRVIDELMEYVLENNK